MIKHKVGRTPMNVTVKGNPEWVVDLALNLELLKVLYPLARSLNLIEG